MARNQQIVVARIKAQRLPSIDAVLASPCTSYWLAKALRSAMDRDPIDALNDAGLLCDLLAERHRQIAAARDPDMRNAIATMIGA